MIHAQLSTRCALTLGLLFLLLSAVIFTVESDAASPQMIKIAKQEGKVVYYNTMSVSEVDRVVKAFEKNYPGIAVESFRTTKEKLVSRLFAEDRAGRTLADVVSVNHAVMHLLRLKGILAKHDNPEASAYGPGFKDRDGYWTGLYGPTAVVVYNVNMVRPEERPKTYEDLLHPKWKRKMALDGSKWEWFAAQLQIMGRERGLTFMKQLAMQDLQLRTGISLLAQLTAAGEFPLMVYGYAHTVEELAAKGAPLGWLPIQPVFMNLVGVGLTAKAPHPNAAQLFIEFLTSREGQMVVSSFHRVPARRDVPADPPRLTQGLKFFTLDPKIAEHYEEYEGLFFKTFSTTR